MADYWPAKDPSDVEPFFMVFCDESGLNDGSASDKGLLQGDTIATATWTFPTGITQDSANTLAVYIQGVNYAINTVATVWISGGTADTDYTITCTITTADDGRTIQRSVVLPVRDL